VTADAEQMDAEDPLFPFRFVVEFRETVTGEAQPTLCRGAFSEVTGLEATMEPVSISEGGVNWGQPQRAGRTTFSTVILRRGLTTTRHLWTWFSHIAREGKYAHRLHVTITLKDMANQAVLSWKLDEAMPVKMKLADLNATSQELGIEELHLVYEGLEEVDPNHPAPAAAPASGAAP
jgi:phage tail-like protein